MKAKKKKNLHNKIEEGMYTDTLGNSSGIQTSGLISDKDRSKQGSMGGVNDSSNNIDDDEMFYEDGYDD